MQHLLILFGFFLLSLNCQDIFQVTRSNIFDTIKDQSPIVILFLDEGADSVAMKQSFENTAEYMAQMAPAVKIGVFQVTENHKVPQDFLIYRLPGVLLFTGLEMPKVYVGQADSNQIADWLSLLLEGSIEHSKQINSVKDFEAIKNENQLILIFLGETVKNQEFSLYLNAVKKAKSRHSDILFCHSQDAKLKQYLKAKSGSSVLLFFNEKENVKYEYQGKLDFFQLSQFIDQSKIQKFFIYDRKELEKQERNQNNLLILFADLVEDDSKQLLESMKAAKHYFLQANINIGIADPYDWNDNTFLQKFNLTNEDLPQLIYLNQENLVLNYNPKKYRYDLAYPNKPITKESIIQFYQDATQETISQFYNSEYMDEEEKELNEELFVKKIVSDNYKEFSKPGEDYSLILYLSDGCVECGIARKLWLEVIKFFRKALNIKFGIINLSKNDHPDLKIKPPHCLLFHQDDAKQMSLSDINTARELKSWLEANAKIRFEEENNYKVKSKTKITEENKIEL